MYRVFSLYFPPPKSFRDSKNKIKVSASYTKLALYCVQNSLAGKQSVEL